MTRQQILDKIAQYEKGLGNPKLPEATKENMKKKIQELKDEASKLEEKIEKVEQKIESDEKKIQSDIKTKIDNYKKGLSNPKLPEATKENMKKKIAELEKEMDAQQKELKEDKKEAQQEKKEVKKAIQEVEKAVKRKAPIKKAPKAPKVKIKQKEREVKHEKRKKKIKEMMTGLEKLVEKNKFLKAKYKGKSVDLEKDSKRAAKPFGYRFVGKHDYRVPTEAQIKAGKKRGTIDYEARPNRSDKYPKGYKGSIKLEEGGMMAKGGGVHSRAKDAQRFAKPQGWRWKNSAYEDGIISKASLSKSPSAKMRKEYPDYVAFEDRGSKSDKHPSRRYKSL